MHNEMGNDVKMLAIFVRITHEAGARGRSRASNCGKRRGEFAGGSLTRQPRYEAFDTGVLDIEKRLGDLQCSARVSHCDESESLL